MKYIYVVTSQRVGFTWEKISQEGYSTLNRAQKFIEDRADNPIKLDDFRYQSKIHSYRIYEISIKNDSVEVQE